MRLVRAAMQSQDAQEGMKARLEKRTAKFQESKRQQHVDPAAPRQAVAAADAGRQPTRLPGQLGVYQIADAKGAVLYIGHAGGALAVRPAQRAAARGRRSAAPASQFRVEVNMQYRTRWFELLMVHQADHGGLPPDNAKNPPPLGRLEPGLKRGRRWISNPAPNSRC